MKKKYLSTYKTDAKHGARKTPESQVPAAKTRCREEEDFAQSPGDETGSNAAVSWGKRKKAAEVPAKEYPSAGKSAADAGVPGKEHPSAGKSAADAGVSGKEHPSAGKSAADAGVPGKEHPTAGPAVPATERPSAGPEAPAAEQPAAAAEAAPGQSAPRAVHNIDAAGIRQHTVSGQNVPRAVLAGCNTGLPAEKYARAIAELRGLAQACGLHVVSSVLQNAAQVSHATCLGSGKVAELRQVIERFDGDIVLFNEALTPMQMRNLEKELDTEVLDRTGLILQIFASRARSREAKLQVESARLQYMLPRLIGMRASLSRQGGGSGRLSNKGAGEQKLELDRRRIEHRITELRRELEVVDRERATQRSRRLHTGLTRVALVGYTNAGKSTVMNALLDYCAYPKAAASASQAPASEKNKARGDASIVSGKNAYGRDADSFTGEKVSRDGTSLLSGKKAAGRNADSFNGEKVSRDGTSLISGKKVFQADMLFATLDTAVRRIEAPGHLPFLLSDTVGFVSDLPHALVKAFRSTLEEVCYADLLLEVVDFSDPDYRDQIAVTARTLEEIGAGHIPVVYLYNKVDLAMAPVPSANDGSPTVPPSLKDRPVPAHIPYRRGDVLYLAAGKGIGISGILDLIDDGLREQRTECTFCIPYTKGALLQQIRSVGLLLSEQYLPEGIRVRVRCRKADAARFRALLQ